MGIDLKSDQLRTNRLIVTGSTLLIYSSSVASSVSGDVNSGMFDRDTSIGTDTFMFVSGTIDSKNTSRKGSVVLGGDVVISGSAHAVSITGSLTRLIDDSSYLVASGSTTITTASSGQITVSLGAIADAPPDEFDSFKHAASGSGYSVWHCPNYTICAIPSAFSVPINFIYATPFIPPALSMTVDALGIRSAGSVAANSVSLGIYANTANNNFYPTTLLASKQTNTYVTVGLSVSKHAYFDTPLILTPGVVYWLACQGSHTQTLGTYGSAASSTMLGYPQAGFDNTTGPWTHISVASTWVINQGLSNTFPTGGLYRAASDTGFQPMVFIHYSS
mgnify:FL=1